VTRKVDRDEAEKFARKLAKGKDFDLEDLLGQLQQLEGMGGVAATARETAGATGGQGGRPCRRATSGTSSGRSPSSARMTPRERRFPKTIDGSRRRRIANGSGTQVADVNRLLKNHLQMQKMMKGMGKGGLRGHDAVDGGRLPAGIALSCHKHFFPLAFSVIVSRLFFLAGSGNGTAGRNRNVR